METSSKSYEMTSGSGMLAFAVCISFVIGLLVGFKTNQFFETGLLGNDWRGISTRRVKMFLDKHGIYGRGLVVGMNGDFDLDLSGSDISDLTLLYGMPIRSLNISESPVTDLSPLMHMHGLRKLDISGTDVSDLSPLARLPLESLNISATRVSDLWPLTNMPMRSLYILTTNITDLTPLRNMRLEVVYFIETNALLEKSTYVLREMPSIQTLNMYGSPEQFWKEYDHRMHSRTNVNTSVGVSGNE